MSKDVIKGYFVAPFEEEADTRIIDTNELINKKLEALNKKGVFTELGGFPSADDANLVGDYAEDGMDTLFGDGDASSGEFSGGIGEVLDGSFTEGNVIKAQPVYDGPGPEELLAQANEQAQQILEDASRQAEEMLQNAQAQGYEEGYNRGYSEGTAKAREELNGMAADLQNQMEAHNAEYAQMISELEPEFIKTLTPIYEHVIGASLANDIDAIKLLISNTINGIEPATNYLVHVCAEDYPTVSAAKDELAAKTGRSDVKVEVVSDSMMEEGACTIETENGIYDCSLGTQLRELAKNLRILSYSAKEE